MPKRKDPNEPSFAAKVNAIDWTPAGDRIAATRSTAVPEDYTDRPVPDEIAALYVAHVERIDAWLEYKGAAGYMDAGLADMLAEFAAAVRETQR